MATESLQARLTEFERQARGVCIGVNHLALDSERVRQAELLQKIIQLEKDIQQSSAQKSHLPDAAAEIRDDVKNNTSALRYLETISQLENSFTVLTENVTETSVQLSAPKELKDEVHVKKELTSNVKSCWTYVSQLARLSQVHIRNAAEYHQFHHAVNEAEASLKARVRMTEPRNSRALPATLKNCTILANELREHLNHMIHLWGRSGNLLEESRRIVPVHLRLGGVIDGLSTNTESASPVMARMLTSLTGPNYELKEGEEVRVISNKDDQHFWTVQTNNGIVKIPSVCLWISDPDLEAVKRSVILREKCIESWDLLVERSRERLRSYYSCLLNQMAENGDIQYQHKIAMDNFLEDLRGLILPNDTRAVELNQAIYAFTERLKMTDISRQRSSHGGVVLREQDIVCMHSPLLRLRDHERQMDHLRAQSELAGTHMTNYLREIDADQKRVDHELSLIDQLQHESQSQLDQLINRVKRWSSRYEHEPNVDSSITNSRISSSLKSSTISDNWTGNNQMYPLDARSPQSIVRETSRLSSRTRSESIPCPVLDAITQIGVTTKTSGTQISDDDGDGGRNKIDLCVSKRQFVPATIPERKQVRNAITQIGVSKVDAGTQDDYHGYSPKRSVKEVLCQIGQITANASCQTLEHYKLQQTLKKPTLDAIVQSGVITKNNSTQSESITETVVKMDVPESQKGARKYSVLDAICQIGQVTQTIGTQIEIENTERNKKNLGVQAEIKNVWQHPVKTTEAACQIGRITINASTEMSSMLISNEQIIRQDMKKSDIMCQIGQVQIAQSTQADLIKHMSRKPSSDVVCQVGSVMESSGIQIDEPHKTSMLLTGTQSAKTPTYTKEIQTDMGFRVEPKFVSKAVNDVICQVGQVNHEVSTQSVEHVTARPAYKDTGIDPIHVWEKKMANDVVTQTGIVHTSKITQAELIQEHPVYVKPIETQDVPITSYKETVDAYQQADLIKHMSRKPSSDVVCQVGSVMESSGIQIDEPHKTSMLLTGTQSAKTPTYTKEIQTDMGFRVEPKFVSKAVNDVICQVGQVNHEVSTQSVEHVTARPAYKDTGIDPIHVWEKKMANDVVTQTGIVHTSKITQAELIQEQPVYVKPIETQDVPITSYKETVDAYQQADLIKHMSRKPSSDVVCQVGSVMESSGIQIDEPHKTSMLLTGTQSAKTPTYTKEIQTDMGFRVEPKFVSKAVNDVICQVGQVNHEVSTQSVEHVTARPAYKDTGIDPIHVWEKKMANDVVTQTGIVHTSKITQAELIQEQPVYVKPMETQDVPITSYKETVDAYQQADLIKHMSRKPSSDVVCQVGSVMESSGIQIDEPHKTSMLLTGTQSAKTPTYTKEIQTDMGFRVEPKFVSKAVNDVICQVGQVNHEVSTQSVEHVTARPAYKDTGIDPIHVWEKKMANDVVTQTGIVHTSKITQAELIQEQPVYVKPIETQDVPITSYKETVDAYQQADLIKHMSRKPSSDVVCQVGSVMESSGIQIDEPHKTSMLLTGTQSAKTPTYTKEIQTDMGFRVEPKFVSKAVNDVICQVGQVNHEVSTQSEIPSIISVGVDPRPEGAVRHLGSYQVPPNTDRQSRQVQADIKQAFKHINMQTDEITRENLISTNLVRAKQKETFEVTTQFGILTKNKDVETFVKCSSKETQTIESSPEAEVKMRSQQTFTRIRSKNYDVQTQSGTINISQAFQTLLDYKPTTEKRSTGMQHEMDFRVVQTTQHEPQTQETPTQTERVTLKDEQSFTPFKLKTYDVQTQFGSMLKTQAAQTPGEQRPVVEMKDMITQHEKSPEPIVHKKLQAMVQPTTINTETQTMEERPPPVILPPKLFDVQTQSGSVTIDSETQTPLERRPVVETRDASVHQETKPVQSIPKKLQATVVPPLENMATQTDLLAQPVVMPMVKTTHHEPQTQETPTQTERVTLKDEQSFTPFKLKTYDVQTQFGSMLKTQAAQTPGEQRPVVEMKDMITQHEKSPEPIVHKKLQAMVQPTTINTETQTMEERPPPVILPPKLFDVQTQSGSVTIDSETQTPLERRPVIEMKELLTQHEKRPEPIVHKKLQAMVQPTTINTETQTMEERPPPVILPPKLFDVQTQSGSVTIDSETQTPLERRPVVETRDASVHQETKPVQSIPKKLQATVVPPLENMATQTDLLAQPVVMPMVKTTHHEPQTQETPTQTERVTLKDEQSFTPFKLKTYDVQTQFGSMLKTQAAQTPGEQRPVVEMKDMITQHEKSPEPIVHKKLQAMVQPTTINTETQTMEERPPPVILPPKLFDVQTQSGSVTIDSETQTPLERRPVIEMKELLTQHEKRPEPIVHKKLQAMVQPTTINTETQTMEERPPPVILPPKLFDVQTQSGSVTIDSETQTPLERRPVVETRDASVHQETKPVQSIPKKLQATVVPPLENMATQTDLLAQPVVMPMVKTTHHEPQTQETPTQTERVTLKDKQSFTPFKLKTYDVQTQFGSMLKTQAAQTPGEQRPVVEMKDMITQHEKSPEPIVHKKLQAMVQPTTINTETQTMEERPPPVILPPKLFDVQTQSGSVTIDSETQTPLERRPVIEMKELLTQHEKRPEPIVHKKLQAMVQPTTINTETQTMEERPPPVILPPKLFDVQTQSGSVTIDSETQTPLERRPVVETRDASVHQETKPVQSIPKKLQATVVPPLENMATQTDLLAQPVVMPMVKTTHHEPQTQETPTQTERVTLKDEQSFTPFKLKTYDVQTQFGSMLKTQAAQTPGEQRPVVEMKDMITQHEKSPEPIVHKKLQAMVQPTTINTETQTMEEKPPPVILPPKLFDVQTQSGSVTTDSETQTPHEQKLIPDIKNVSVSHESHHVQTVNKKLQAVVYNPSDDVCLQTEEVSVQPVRPVAQVFSRAPQVAHKQTQAECLKVNIKTFDIQAQSGMVVKTQSTQTILEEQPVFHTADVSVIHSEKSHSLVNKKLQTDPMTQVPTVLPKTTFDVVTQSGTIHCAQSVQTIPEERPVFHTADVSVIHSEKSPSLVGKKVQATMCQSVDNTSTQTDPMTQVPTVLPKTTFDVVTQSGTIHCAQSVQTIPEERPVFHTADVSVIHSEKSPSLVGKKVQATMRQSVDNTSTQTDPMTQVPTVLPKTTFDVVTQSGTIHCAQSVQTIPEERPVFHTADVSVIHSEKSHSLVNKKLQVNMRQSVDNTSTQTDPMTQVPTVLPKTTFDVVTQSGTIHCAQSVQTIPEERPVFHTADVSVIHSEKSPSLVGKKVQATMRQSVDNTSTQTDPMTQVPTVLPKTTFDVVTQSGTIHCAQSVQTIPEERPVYNTVGVGVDHTGKLQPVLYENVQATMRQSVDNTSTQTDPMTQVPTVLPKTTFDVVTQSGTIQCAQSVQTIPEERPVFHTADVSVIHSEKSPSLVGKKVQATMRQSVDNTSTQTDPMTQVPTVLPKTTFDVVTQSGTIQCAQSVQTIPEERPVFHTADVSVIHSEKSHSLVNKKLQVNMRQSVDNTSTQTDPMTQVPTVLPKTTFDVVTQSGTIHCAQSVQTIPEERPVYNTVGVGVDHTGKLQPVLYENVQATMRQSVDNTSTQTDPMTQVPTVLPKTTFDVVTQSGTIHCAQSVQTIPEERPVFHTADVSVIHSEKSPSLVGKKVQATMRQSVDNTSTQTDPMTQVPTVLPKTTFDVVTQSGTIHCAQSVQTIPEERPVYNTVGVGVDHTGKLQPVLYENVQATMRQSVDNTSTQTDPMTQVPTVLPKTTFDVVTQSGTIHCAQSVQTIPEERPVFHTADVSVIHSEKSPSLVGKKVQATMRQSVDNTSTQTDPMTQVPTVLPKTTFDVVTQSGTLSLTVGCQAVLISEDFLMKDVAVAYVRSVNSCFSKAVQASIQVESKNVEIQCLIKDESVINIRNAEAQFDVLCRQEETQTFSLPSTTTREGSVQHAPTTTQIINKKLQVTISQSVREAAAQTYESIPVVTVPTMQRIHHSVQTHEISSQTDSPEFFDRQSYARIKSQTNDVEIQSGIICKSQGLQTKLEHKTFGMTKETSTQYEAVQSTMINIDIQADAQHPVYNTYVQTDESQLINIRQKHQTNVQTQSGIIQKEQGAQTLEEVHTTVNKTDVSVTHELKNRRINKKLQATIMSQMKDEVIQTELVGTSAHPTPTNPTFDVQTQSGSVKIDSETQTPHEQKLIPDIKNVSVSHESHHVQTVNKKLQAVVYNPSDDVCLQTEEVSVQPVRPVAQVFSRAPQVAHKQTQAECLKVNIKTFDIQAQSGMVVKTQSTQTILEEKPVFHTADVSVIHSEKSHSLVNKKLQVNMRQSVDNTSTQTDPMTQVPTVLPKTTFDVVTQSGTIHCAQSVQTIPEERPVYNTVGVGVDHTGKLQPVLYENVQATMRQSVDNTSTQTDPMTQAPTVLPKTTFDVVTQSGTIHCAQSVQTIPEERPVFHTADVSVIHSEKSPSLVGKKVQATMRQSVDNTSTQTDPMTQVPTVLPKTTFDVVTQSGTIHCAQSVQTIPEERPVYNTVGVGVDHTGKLQPVLYENVQATMRQSVDNTSTQTDPMTQVPTVLPKTTFDVVTQSGTIHCAQSVQTIPEERPVFHTADVSVIHSEKSPSLVGKKVQATMRQSVDNTSTQTDPMIQVPTVLPKTTFDVVTQSGTIHCAQSVQTIPEERPVYHTVGVGVDHTGKLQPVLYENVQATMRQSVDNTSTQTDPMTQVPTVLPKTTFDVVTQSGTIHCAQSVQTIPEERPVFHTADVSVIHSEKSPSLVGKKVQATMRQSVDNTSTQTDPMTQVPTVLPKTTFDVVTQSGTIHCAQSVQTIPEERPVFHTADVSVIHSEKSPSLVGKKVQATMRQSVDNTSTQTDPMTQVPTVLPKTTFDVVTQSGTIHCAQSVQTIPEERPVYNTVGVGVDHTGKLQPVLYENVQATMRQSVDNTSTQTDPMTQVPTVLPKTTFDVVTQSGTIQCAQSVQTIPEERPVFHTADVSVIHSEKSPSLVGKKVQATMRQSVDNTSTQTDPMTQVPTVLPKTTFDVVTQSGTIHCAQSVQTIPEERPVFHTADVSVIHSEKSPSLVGKKVQATMRQSVDNTSTQTDPMIQVPTVLPKTTFDVVTQSGTIQCAQSVQTIPEERPVFHTADVSVIHSEKSPSLVGKKVQATMRQSVDNTSTQTDPMTQVPTVLPKTTFDVVTQSGTVHCAQSVQTIPEERLRFDHVDVSVDHFETVPIVRSTISSTMHTLPSTSQSTQTTPTKLADTFCQATLSSTTYDVQIQSGVMHSIDGTQTVDLRSPIEMKEMSVAHEKERTVLKGKKLQVHCDSTDLGVQTDQITPIVRSTISSTMHTLPNTSQSTQTTPTKLADTFCQATLSSTTYDVQIQSGVMHSIDGTQTVDLRSPIEMKEMSVAHEKERTVLKGKKLQVHCDSTDLGVQTDQITPIVRSTISSTMHTLPNTSQSTQTTPTKLADTFCQATLSSTTYDVQIQSGVMHSIDGTQTVDLRSPIEMKEMSVAHEKERTVLKGKKLQVRCDSTDLGVQTDQITPIVRSTISSTMHTLPNTSQSTQTTPTKLADTFCQATLSSTTYDVQIQSGVMHSIDGTQTVDLRSPIEMKEMSVAHEKERTVLKGKKLQVHCDSTDLGVQTDHTMSTVHLDSKLTQTALVRYTDVSCQYTELTKPSSTSHAVTSRVVSIQTDVPFSTNVRVDQRNKKFQVNLISPSSPKTPINVASIGTQTSDYRYQDISIEQVDKTIVSSVDAHVVHDSASNVTNTSQAIPKIKIDQECQVKITPQQYQKKLQYGSSFSTLKNTSSQTIQDSCLYDHHKTSSSSSIGVQASNIRPVVTVDTGTQETRPSETSPSPLQVKNKKLQVYPSKLGEQVEEEFTHPQETISKGMSTSLTEITQTDECLLKNIECFKCISRGYDKKTIDKDMQSEEKSIRTKQTASSTVKSNYFTRILQMETIPDKPKASDTSDVLKLYRESGYRARGESKNIQTDTFLLGNIQLPESREVDSIGKISKKTTIVQLEKLTTDKCVDTMPFEKGLIESQISYHDTQISERRNIKLLKETPWSEAQVSNVLQDIQYEIRHPQIIDSSGSYSPQQNSVAVSARPTTHMLAHTESTSRNGNGKAKTPYQYLKPDVVSWGVQFAPVTLTGVTQTTESSKHKLTIDSPVNIGVQTDAIEDDYYIKRVVTTIARKGLSSYCRRGPVAKRIVEHTDLLTSSLPSNLDEEFDEETTIAPRTTKVTTMQKRGDRRVVHEELLTEDYRERGSSLDSHVAHERFLRETHPQDIDLHGMHEHETGIYTDAEICLQNLLKVWGEQYLLSRLRTIGRYSELSVSLDRSIHAAEKSRLVEAKTQFTSTGNLVSQIRNLENMGTQTSDILLTTRPPHKNKRIQRGRSFISGGTNQPPPTRSGSVVSPLSPTTEELTSHHRQHGITSMQTRTSHPFNLATTTFTETTQEQSTFSIEHTIQTYICPTCGSQASIPVTVHSQIQPQTLPITQLKDAQSQTRFVGQMTADNNCTYLPTYLSDEEVIRINQSQKIEDREFSVVTWHPAEIRDTERRRDSDTSNQIRDEVWVDSPGKLLELKITGVIVPGTSKIVSASEAFYRGLLRVVYWDYEKLGPRQSSVDSTVSIPLADAVISKAVRLASDRISTEAQPSLDAKIVWRTPEIQRSRYLVHSIRPDAGQNKHNPINLDVASAIRAGLIDKETGRMLFTHSVYESLFSTDSPISKKGDSSSDQTERLSVREAILRGFLVAELIEPESSYITKQSLPFIVPSTSYSHSPTDVDI
ncbi:unnamed protein product [Schistosoma intercalatum]|nr:unnamed protein product [Schistosoma intercalatum]